MDITQFRGAKNGTILRDQFLDVCLRVKLVRPFIIKNMIVLLKDPRLRTENIEENGMCENLYAAGWIVGEYCESPEECKECLEQLLHPDVNRLPEHIQAIYISSVFKLFSRMIKQEDLPSVIKLIRERIEFFLSSIHLEVQERASTLNSFVNLVIHVMEENKDKLASVSGELESIYSEIYKPTSKDAIHRVPLPEGLDLDAWIFEPLPPEETLDETGSDYGGDRGFDDPGWMSETMIETKHTYDFPEEDINEKQKRVDENKKKIKLERQGLPDYLRDEPDGPEPKRIHIEIDRDDERPKEVEEVLTQEEEGQKEKPITFENRRPRVAQPRLNQVRVEIEGDEQIPEWNGEVPIKLNTPSTKAGGNTLGDIDLNDDSEPIVLVKQVYPSKTESPPEPRRGIPPRGSPRMRRPGNRGSPRIRGTTRGRPRGSPRGGGQERGSPRGRPRGGPRGGGGVQETKVD